MLGGLLALALLATPGAAIADDRANPPPAVAGGANPSGLKPPPADDRTFVVNEAPALDGPCRFNGDGPLVIDVPVGRYAGETDNDGHLKHADALIAAGTLDRFARLKLVAYDVDNGCGASGEKDEVSFNGAKLTTPKGAPELLTGADGEWKEHLIATVPIERVAFPKAPGVDGNPPTPAVNKVQIDIDVDAAKPGKFCLAVDWVALDVKLMSPVVLIHGNGSSGHIFRPPPPNTAPADVRKTLTNAAGQGFTTFLDEKKLVWDSSVDLNPASSVAANGKKLGDQIPKIARQLGVDSLHLVAHSKGGLDARQFLQHHHDQKTLRVVSFTTLSTPHDGSVLADVMVTYKDVKRDEIKFGNGFPASVHLVVSKTEFNEGYRDLTTGFTAAFNPKNVEFLAKKLPGVDKEILGTIGADLDQDGDRKVGDGEWKELRDEHKALTDNFNSGFAFVRDATKAAMNDVYTFLGGTARIETETQNVPTPDNRGLRTVATVKAHPAAPFRPNDSLVTVASAHGEDRYKRLPGRFFTFDGANGKNHASICGAASAKLLANPNKPAVKGESTGWLLEAERAIGDLR